jgi:hypothetical protein
MPEKPSKLTPALYGGIVMGVISGLPFLNMLNCFCCAGVLLGGFLSVFFYTKDLTPAMSPLTSNDSILLGALAGVFGAIIGTALNAIMLLSVGNVAGEALAEILMGVFESMNIAGQLPPEAIEQLESLKDVGFSGVAIIMNFVQSIIIDPLFGLLGGLIGYAVFKPKPTIMNVPPPNQV